MAQKEIKIKNTMMASLIFLLLVAGIFMIKVYLDGHFRKKADSHNVKGDK